LLRGSILTFGVFLLRCGFAVGIAALLMPGPARSAAITPLHAVRELTTAANASRALAAAVVPSNTTVADPAVPRPDTTPCTVTLFTGDSFNGFAPLPFAFTPPPACPGPWAKVVLTVDISVDPGNQFDRTATIGLGGATIFFGTTSEPFSNEGPSWSTQSDLTDLSALFRTPQTGQVSLGNVVNSTYTSVLHGSAKLQFYPSDRRYPAPRVADIVVPLADVNGNPVALDTTASLLPKTFTAPRNVEGAYLDVFSQSQSSDEFWYTCVPTSLAAALESCGSTAFREADAFVDKTPAGVAPVYPWIYTGGIDPFLWSPIPGVQTLNFKPYRVDLTPFAATFDDGKPHTVALSVYNADSYFQETANLLLFLDHGAKHPLTGKLDADTLGGTPPEVVDETGTFAPNGTIDTRSARRYHISGHLDTSHGRVSTTIDATTNFTQHTQFVNAATSFEQNISQNQITDVLTATTSPSGTAFAAATYVYPLALDISQTFGASVPCVQTTTVKQTLFVQTATAAPWSRPQWSAVFDSVSPHDTLTIPASGPFSIANTGSSQLYVANDSNGGCYGRRVTSANLLVTRDSAVSCNIPRP
jgi:hypothetical protein